MNKLEEIKQILLQKNASLVVYYQNGEIKEYYQDGIKDIKAILKLNQTALQGAIVADKVIGKVAASILVIAGVKEIYAEVMSQYAIPVLEENKVQYTYKEKVDYIANQTKTDMCPMERQYKDEKNLHKIYGAIIQA